MCDTIQRQRSWSEQDWFTLGVYYPSVVSSTTFVQYSPDKETDRNFWFRCYTRNDSILSKLLLRQILVSLK